MYTVDALRSYKVQHCTLEYRRLYAFFPSYFAGFRKFSRVLSVAVLRQELDNLATFLRMAVQYKNQIGASFQLLLEPKPQVDWSES